MADIAASVLARLKNKAAESGRSYQLCLQLFCKENQLTNQNQLALFYEYRKILPNRCHGGA